jgi:hypothetical protein
VTTDNGVLTRTWLGLISATFVSWAVAEGSELARLVGVLVLIVAGIKAGLVIRHFMEIGRGSQGWEWFFLVWLLAVSAMLVVTSLLA